MTALADALLAELVDADDAALDALALALAPRLLALLDASPEDRWLNTKQAAEHLGCSRERVWDLVQLKRLDVKRDGRSLRFCKSDLDSYLESSR